MTYLTKGIVLRRDDWGDYDRLLVIYTNSHGKISAIAKGAKKPISKLSSHLEQLATVDLMIAPGAVINRIAGATIEKGNLVISSNFCKSIAVSFCWEIVDLLIKNDFHDEEVFDLLENLLASLSVGESPRQDLLIVNRFLFNLLSHLGYCPIVRAKNQRELLSVLHRLVVEVSERSVQSFKILKESFV